MRSGAERLWRLIQELTDSRHIKYSKSSSSTRKSRYRRWTQPQSPQCQRQVSLDPSSRLSVVLQCGLHVSFLIVESIPSATFTRQLFQHVSLLGLYNKF